MIGQPIHAPRFWARGTVAALLAGGSLLTPGCAVPVPDAVLCDLVASFRVAEVHREAAVIDIGTPGGRRHLGDGWSDDERRRDGTTFVWGTGELSVIRFFLSESRDLQGTLRLQPFTFPGAPPQQLVLEVDGRQVADLTLDRGVREYSVVLPADALTAGENLLAARYRYSRRVSQVRPSNDHRSLAVAWESVRFANLTDAAEPSAAEDSPVLEIPSRAEVAYYLESIPGSRLCWQRLVMLPARSARLEVWWDTDDGPAQRVAWFGDETGETCLDLPGQTLQATRLALRAVPVAGAAADGGRVMLERPLVVGRPPASPWGESERGAAGRSVGDRARPPNVLVYLVDTLRSDRLGCYGHPVPVSPNIDRLAADALLFEHVVASSPWTKPSVVSILTGSGR